MRLVGGRQGEFETQSSHGRHTHADSKIEVERLPAEPGDLATPNLVGIA